jgi:hypothetical protein
MRTTISVLLTLLLEINFSLADEGAFRDVKLADAKGKQADASLIFSDNDKNVVVHVADRDVLKQKRRYVTSSRENPIEC